ncbi:SDR family NAD(P)-dependent oxidoreductase [Streptomyces sp. NPDC051963]
MTGATSGLGAVAARYISQTPDTRLIVGSRGKRVDDAETESLDLSRLASTRAFAQRVCQLLGDTPIDVLVLNAGLGVTGDSLATEDGYETVFATNHLAHYLLLRLFVPHLSPTATVVVTTSDTHDPKINKLAPPRHAYADALALPEAGKGSLGILDSFRAYSSSKLCNLLTARGLAQYGAERGSSVTVVAYNPGFTPGTGLNRSANRTVRTVMSAVVPVARRFLHINTVVEAGRVLADLALGEVRPPDGRIYASLVRGELTWPDPAPLARSDSAMDSLWRDSAALVGLEPNP